MNTKKLLEQIKSTLTIAKYMILMFFRERTAIFFSLFIPIMLMSIFGVINLGGSIKFDVGVVDEANNTYSHQIVDVIRKIDAFNVTTETKDQALAELKDSKLTYVLAIPSGFGANLTEYTQTQAKLVTLPASQQLQELKQGISVSPQEVDVYYDQSQNASTISVGFTIFDKVFDGLPIK